MKVTLFIDVQNDFIDGALGCDMAKKTIADVVKYAEKCAADNECLMLATQDTHEETVYAFGDKNSPMSGYMTTLEGKKLPVEHCVKGTVGHELQDGLYNAMKSKYGQNMHKFILEKRTFGLKEIDQNIFRAILGARDLGKDIDKIEICGYCTSICVISNALILRAAFPDMKIELISNLCGDINEDSHNAALTVARNCQIDVVTA